MAKIEKILDDFDDIQSKNRNSLIKEKERSDNDFEKNLVFITTGTLVLSLTFIDKIAPLENAKGVLFLIFSWSLLAISLLVNLFSHQLASKYTEIYIAKIDRGIEGQEVNKLMTKNNKTLTKINNVAICLLIFGIFALVVYCSINAWQMSNLHNDKKEEKIYKPQKGQDLNKGRSNVPLIQRPVAPISPSPPSA